ncbi:MAG: hypothetical protein KGJ34_00120 [Patescibacteria group bacterium]|nr:hypothetical protein [Patescibacteria group bacterium]
MAVISIGMFAGSLQFAQAQETLDGGCCGSTGWDTTGGTDSYAPSTGWDTTSGTDSYVPSTGWDTTAGTDSYVPSTGWDTISGTDSYVPYSSAPTYTASGDYTATGSYLPSYGYSSASYGGYALGGAFGYSNPSYSRVYAPTTVLTNTIDNGNSCTAINSCNTNTTVSSPTTISYNNSSPSYPLYPIYPSYPSYPTYPSAYQAPTCSIQVSPSVVAYGQGVTLSWTSSGATSGNISNIGNVAPSGTTYLNAYQTIVYNGTFYGPAGSTNCSATISVSGYNNPAPYVTLSQVPYTGLDLGPTGTALYWLFLVLWCAIAAYFIAVKKIHIRIINWSRGFFLGDADTVAHPAYQGAHSSAAKHSLAHTVQSGVDTVDNFILAQVHRGHR